MAVKSWCGTLNNWTEDEHELLKGAFSDGATRAVIGKEVGSSGTPHLQMAVTFRVPKRLGAMKRLSDRAHWEQMRASEAAFEYCKKDGDFWEFDTRRQGARSDLSSVQLAAQSGMTVREYAWTPGVTLNQLKHFQTLQALKPGRTADDPLEIIWCWGPTGAGKSAWVRDNYPGYYRLQRYDDWFAYCGEETILVDEFRADFCKFHQLLTLTDRYEFVANAKYTNCVPSHRRIVFTSPYPPEMVYSTQEHLGQLLRRIDRVIEFEAPVVPVRLPVREKILYTRSSDLATSEAAIGGGAPLGEGTRIDACEDEDDCSGHWTYQANWDALPA